MPVYVIGDIHGELSALQTLVEWTNPTPDDIVIQLGDCINRGEWSYEVIDYWLHFDRCTRFVLGGNHEEMLFDYLSESSGDLMNYGGEATIRSYQRNGWECKRGDPQSIPEAHFQFLLQTYQWTRAVLPTSRYIFTHAGYDHFKPANEQSPSQIRWGSVVGWKEGKPVVVRGHRPGPRVRRRPGLIEVDTGCGLGGPLSCLCLETGKVITAHPDELGHITSGKTSRIR